MSPPSGPGLLPNGIATKAWGLVVMTTSSGLREEAEVFELHLLRDRLPDLLELVHGIDRVELARLPRIDLSQPQLREAFPRELRVVAGVEEGFAQILLQRHQRSVRMARHEVPDLAVEDAPIRASTDGAAVDV